MKLHIFILVNTIANLLLITCTSSFSVAQTTTEIADGDVEGLITALENANLSPGTDSIVLAENGTYLLTQRHSCVTGGFFDYRETPVLPCSEGGLGPVGLPQVTRVDWGGKLIVNGRGSVIRRSTSAEAFRIWFVWTDGEADFYNLTLENGNALRSLRPQQEIQSGGAMYFNINSKVKLENCNFRNNQSAGQGGALRISARNNTQIINCEFRNNRAADEGGGVHNVVSPITIIGSRFFDNVSGFQGGGFYSDGNDWEVDGSRTVLKDCLFEGNSVESTDGRGVAGGGAYLFLYRDHIATIDGCTFRNNATAGRERGSGGALLLSSGDRIFDRGEVINVGNNTEYRVSNTLIVDNSSTFLGGGVSLGTGTFSFVNNTIVRNRVENNLGIDALGGGILYNDSRAIFVNCTVSENFARNRGGGVFYSDGNGQGQAQFYNCLFVNNEAFNDGDRNPTIHNNCSSSVNRTSFGRNNIEFPELSGVNADRFCIENIQLVDPNLGELQDNGGAVLTMMPSEQGAAFEMGDIECLPEIFRPSSGVVNIGAFPLAFSGVPEYTLVGLKRSGEEGFIGAVFPNPIASNQLTVEINPTPDIGSDMVITISDRFGRILFEQTSDISGGTDLIVLPIDPIAFGPGMHFISVRSGGLSETKRLVILSR